MAKTKRTLKLQKRDWAIIVLFLVVIGTNWMWYQSNRDIHKILEAQGWNDYKLFVQDAKLHLCFEQDTRPCDVSPPEVPQVTQ